MPKINIDELVEPIEVTVGGKSYTVADISPDTAKKITKLAGQADTLRRGVDRTIKQILSFEDAGDFEFAEAMEKQLLALQKKEEDSSIFTYMVDIMSGILSADKADIAKLGIRKLTLLIQRIMSVVNEEPEAKNVPKAAVTK